MCASLGESFLLGFFMSTNVRQLIQRAGPEVNEILRLAQETRAPAVIAAFALLLDRLGTVITRLEEVKAATIQPELLNTVKGPPVVVYTVRVATSGTEVQGPDVAVPRGFRPLIRQRYHAGTPTGRVSFLPKGTGHTDSRMEIRNNDSFEASGISNLSQIYFDSDTAATVFEIICPYAAKQ